MCVVVCCVLRLLSVKFGLSAAVLGVRYCLLRVVCWCCLFFVLLLLSVPFPPPCCSLFVCLLLLLCVCVSRRVSFVMCCLTLCVGCLLLSANV